VSPEITTLLLQSALVLGLAFLAAAFVLSRYRYETMASARSPEEQVELAVSKVHARRDKPCAVLVAGSGKEGPFRSMDEDFTLADGTRVWVMAADADRLDALKKRLSDSGAGIAVAPPGRRQRATLLAEALEMYRGTEAASAEPGSPEESLTRHGPSDQSRLLDPHTGVLRSDRIGQVFPRFIRRARVRKRRVSILHVALDRAGTVESLHGEAALDEAIRHLSGVLQMNLREEDLIARLDRTEFVACLEAEQAGGEAAAKRLEQAVRETPCKVGAEAVAASLHLTVCIGVATEPEHGRTINQLLDATTHALSEAKKVGAGTVRVFNETLLRRTHG